MTTQCFKIKRGTEFDKEVKKHFRLLERWKNVFPKVSELLGEEITKMSPDSKELNISLNDIHNEATKKLFKKDGTLKKNVKESNRIRREYLKIIADEGLEEYEPLAFINFRYGAMRRQGQKLKSFRTSDDDVYYEADFDLEKKTGGLVEPISEIEYQEKYLEEIKKREQEVN